MTNFLTYVGRASLHQMVNLSFVKNVAGTIDNRIVFSFIDGSDKISFDYETDEEAREAFNEIMKKISINPFSSKEETK